MSDSQCSIPTCCTHATCELSICEHDGWDMLVNKLSGRAPSTQADERRGQLCGFHHQALRPGLRHLVEDSTWWEVADLRRMAQVEPAHALLRRFAGMIFERQPGGDWHLLTIEGDDDTSVAQRALLPAKIRSPRQEGISGCSSRGGTYGHRPLSWSPKQAGTERTLDRVGGAVRARARVRWTV